MHNNARTRNRIPFRSWMNAAIAVTFISMSSIASAGMHLSLSGSQSTSNAGYQKIQSGSGSASVAFEIWDYLRLGYTYRQELAYTGGYTESKDANGNIQKDSTGASMYVKFLNRSKVISDSVDLTVVLYAGEVFMPYVFVGAGRKNYNIVNSVEGQEDDVIKLSMPPSPNGGAGIGVQLSRRFSLKFSYTVSQGYKQLPGQPLELTLDSFSQVGISYAL